MALESERNLFDSLPIIQLCGEHCCPNNSNNNISFSNNNNNNTIATTTLQSLLSQIVRGCVRAWVCLIGISANYPKLFHWMPKSMGKFINFHD